jgi:hypothetical protein
MKHLFTLILLFSFHQFIGQVRIYEIFGGGDNAGSLYRNDYVVLFNAGGSAVDLSGWSLQYASAVGSSWVVVPLGGTIPGGGRYFLIQLGSSGNGGGSQNLPAADLFFGNNINATEGKFILKDNTIAETTTNPANANIKDKVGYGADANGFETARAPAPSNTKAIRRINGGQDTDNNQVDFSIVDPMPLNALPVVLIAFGVKNVQNKQVEIKWETSEENGSEDFILEKSLNLRVFEEVNRIKANGFTEKRSLYSFIDTHPYIGQSYYRLRQIDQWGQEQVFEPVAYFQESEKLFEVWGNPITTPEITLKVAEKGVVFSIFTSTGIAHRFVEETGGDLIKLRPSTNISGQQMIIVAQLNNQVQIEKVIVK